MTELVWDQIGERFFETGVERGVLYLPDNVVIPWNGLVSIEETITRESQSYYLDGVKYLEHQVLGEFAGKLKAFTYPDEMDEVTGIVEFATGAFLHDQKPKSFALSYRTLIGNDVDGTDHGYRIHVIYNLLAIPDAAIFESLSNAVKATEFSWTLTATPENVPGYRPTAHISFKSTDIDPDVLSTIEALLYGSEVANPLLPSLAEFVALIETDTTISIVDHGDGTWSAIGPEENISMLDPTTFQIVGADATYLDPDTYEISTTEL